MWPQRMKIRIKTQEEESEYVEEKKDTSGVLTMVTDFEIKVN